MTIYLSKSGNKIAEAGGPTGPHVVLAENHDVDVLKARVEMLEKHTYHLEGKVTILIAEKLEVEQRVKNLEELVVSMHERMKKEE